MHLCTLVDTGLDWQQDAFLGGSWNEHLRLKYSNIAFFSGDTASKFWEEQQQCSAKIPTA
jgi:hypothetical protein